ncbi:MAG: hypothetical protein H6806_03855 [Planctomycetes bacterium]|nr:hypothetical protein [Planctomycetota bacterium]
MTLAAGEHAIAHGGQDAVHDLLAALALAARRACFATVAGEGLEVARRYGRRTDVADAG